MEIPEALSLRETSYNWVVGLTLFFSLSLLAIARARQSNVYYAISRGMLKSQSLRGFVREEMPIRSGASLILLLNYLIASGLIVYLIATHSGQSTAYSWLLALIVPSALFFFHSFSLLFSSWITGEAEPFRAPFVIKVLGSQLLGIIYFVCATFWVLQPDYVDILLQIVIWTFLLENALRILKSVFVVLRKGVTWYYIILYFCTLEILPLLIVYYYGMQNFTK